MEKAENLLDVDRKLEKYIALFERCEREIAMNFKSASKDYKVIYKNISQILGIYDFCLTDVISPYLALTKQGTLETAIKKIVTGYHVQMASLFNMVVEYIKTFAELREEIAHPGGEGNEKIERMLSFNSSLIQLVDLESEKSEEIKELRIDQTWYKVDPKLFPIKTQLKANQFIEYLQSERLLFSAPVNIPRAQVAESSTNNYFSNLKKKEEEKLRNQQEANSSAQAKTEAPIQIKEKSDIIRNATKLTLETNQKANLADGRGYSLVSSSPLYPNGGRMSVKVSSPLSSTGNRGSVKDGQQQQTNTNNLSVDISGLLGNIEEKKELELSEMLKNYEDLAKKIQNAAQEKKSDDMLALKNTILNINASFSLFKTDSDKLKRSTGQDAFGKHNHMFRDSIYKVNENIRNMQPNNVYQPPPKKNEVERPQSTVKEFKENSTEFDSDDEQARLEEQKELDDILRNKYVVNQRLSTMSSEKTKVELAKLLENFKSQRAHLNSLGNDMRNNIKNMEILEMNRESEDEEDSSEIIRKRSHTIGSEKQQVKKKKARPAADSSKSLEKETREVATQFAERLYKTPKKIGEQSKAEDQPVAENTEKPAEITSELKKELLLMQEKVQNYELREKPKLLKTIEELRALVKSLQEELEKESKENGQLVNNIEDYKKMVGEIQTHLEQSDSELFQARKLNLDMERGMSENLKTLEKSEEHVRGLLTEKENMLGEIKYLRDELDYLMTKNDIILGDKKKGDVSNNSLTSKNRQLEREINEMKERLSYLQRSSMSSEKSQSLSKRTSVVPGANEHTSRSSVSDRNSQAHGKRSLAGAAASTSSKASFLKRALEEIKPDEANKTIERKNSLVVMNTVVDLDKMTAKVKGKFVENNQAEELQEIAEIQKTLENEREIEISVEDELSKAESPDTNVEDEVLPSEVSRSNMNKTHPLNFPESTRQDESLTDYQEPLNQELKPIKDPLQRFVVPQLNLSKNSIPSDHRNSERAYNRYTSLKKVLADASTQSINLEALDYLMLYLAERRVDKAVAQDIEEFIGSFGKKREQKSKPQRSSMDHDNYMMAKRGDDTAVLHARDIDLISETHDNSRSSPLSNYDKSLSNITEKKGFAELDEDPIKTVKRRKSQRTHSETHVNLSISQVEGEDDKYQRMYGNFKKIIEKNGFNVIKNSSNTISSMFKSIFNIPEGQTDWKNLPVPTFEDFKESIKKMQVIHIRCGAECPHLKRFYEFLGYYQSKVNMKPVFVPHKRTITRLPKIKQII